jgi:predicted nucleic acid-binding protein
MNFFFLDASALAKRYSLEDGADQVDHLFGKVPRNRLMCLLLGAAEVLSVLVRRRNGGRLSASSFSQGVVNLHAEIIEATDFQTLPAENDLIIAALPFLERYSVNSTDAIVLRLALDFADQFHSSGNNLVLVTSDQRLLRAAQAEGLLTFNPETQSQTDLDALLGPDQGKGTSP